MAVCLKNGMHILIFSCMNKKVLFLQLKQYPTLENGGLPLLPSLPYQQARFVEMLGLFNIYFVNPTTHPT